MPKAVIPAVINAAIAYAYGGPAAAIRAFVITAALTAVSQALTKKPKNKNPILSQTEGGAVSIRQPIAPWQVILGRARVGGILTFRYVSPDRRFWHMVITIACHRIEAVDEIYFNDQRITINANGDVFGNYAKAVEVPQSYDASVGPTRQVTIPDLIAVRQIRMQFVIGLQPMRQVEPGAHESTFDWALSGTTIFFHPDCPESRRIVIDYFVADLTGGSWARVKVSLGDEAAGVQPFPDLVAESGGVWSPAHAQYGHAKLYIRLEANHDIFPTGVPNVTVVARGARLYDPRDGVTRYSNNAALAVNHYLTNTDYGLAADQADEIHEDDLTSAASSCDDAIDLGLGGHEPRYTVNGTFLTSEEPKAVLERLLSACAGSLVNLGDKWHVNVGVYHVPTVTLSLGDRAGPDTVSPMLPSRDDGNANAIKGVFTNPLSHWQPDDFPAIISDAYLADDDHERRYKDIDLTAFVTSATQAQRLAKIDLLRLRQGLTQVSTWKLPAWQVIPGRTVNLVDADMGWNPKAFEIDAAQLSAEADGTLAVELTLRETAAAIYDWSTSEEQAQDFAPNTSMPDPSNIAVPGAPMISEQLVQTRSSRGLAVLVTMSWVASTSPFATHYRAEYRAVGAASWTVLPLQLSTSLEIFDVAPGRYDFRVKALDPTTGASSDYSTTSNVEIIGLTDIPADLTGLSIQAAGGLAVLRWDLHPARDVREGGGILFRHSAMTEPAAAVWEESFSIGERIAGSANQASLALKPGTYLARVIDSGGRLSVNATKISSKQASVHAFVNIDALQEDATFPGTHDGSVAADGVLKLAGAGSFDAIPDLDAVPNLDGFGGIGLAATYTFSTNLDLGSVQSVRLTSQLAGFVANVNDQIDSRTELIDAWDDFDGTAGASADAYVEVRETDDDPASSPTWSAWKRLDAAEFQARAFEFRARLATADAAYNVHLDTLRVSVAQIS